MAYIGEIRMFPYAYPNGTARPPSGWLLCDGRSYNSYTYGLQGLFSVIGTRFGGSDETDFRVPDLRNRLPVSLGRATGAGATGSVTWTLGMSAGMDAVALSEGQLPLHTHAFQVFAGAGDDGSHGAPVAGDYLRRPLTRERGAVKAFSPAAPPASQTPLDLAVTTSGGSGTPPAVQPHPNLQPSLAMNFFICWDGYYPYPDAALETRPSPHQSGPAGDPND